VHVVGYVLEIPFELSAVCVECDGTVRVKIVSFAAVAVPIRRGIAGSPDDEVLFRIKRTGNPRMPYSPPLMPQITISFTISGATVMLYPVR
jgi:hypothetical protein